MHFQVAGGGTVDVSRSYTVASLNGSLDRVGSYLGTFFGLTKFGAAGSGRSGNATDFAVDVGSGGVKSGVLANTDSTLFDAINQAFSNDVATISVWVKYRAIGAYSLYMVYSPTASGNKGWHLHCPYSNGNVYYDLGGDGEGQRIYSSIANFPDFSGSSATDSTWWQTWHNIVGTKNGTNQTLWIDGQQFMSTNNALPLVYDISAIYMGDRIAGASINGWIDDFAMYNTELSESEIANLATGTAPDQIEGSSLIAWWDFNDAPAVGLTADGGSVIVNFNGVLQSSTNVSGPYVDMTEATSPYTNAISGSAKFFRARRNY